jgi:hypothetical protein
MHQGSDARNELIRGVRSEVAKTECIVLLLADVFRTLDGVWPVRHEAGSLEIGKFVSRRASICATKTSPGTE